MIFNFPPLTEMFMEFQFTSLFSMKALLLLGIVCSVGANECFKWDNTSETAPRTYMGDSSIACNPTSSPRATKGFATFFSDDTYACYEWNYQAKKEKGCFVALNGVCKMNTQAYCNRCIEVTNSNGQSQRCTVIDFCDEQNCNFLDPGHLDFLNNNGNSAYKLVDTGKYISPHKRLQGHPIITWKYC